MVIVIVWRSMSGTIQRGNIAMGGSGNCLSVQEKKSSCVPSPVTPVSCGVSLSTMAGKQGLTALSLGMKERIAARYLWRKRIGLLIASGLIAGITPLSIRRGSGQLTLDAVFRRLDGDGPA
jgi:hypothetical protein